MFRLNRRRRRSWSIPGIAPIGVPLRRVYVVLRTAAVIGAIVWAGGTEELTEMGRQLSGAINTVSQQIEAANKPANEQQSKGSK